MDNGQTYATFTLKLSLADDGGFGVDYTIDGMSNVAAIGWLTVVQDRLRAVEAADWPTCPRCHGPMEDHEGGCP